MNAHGPRLRRRVLSWGPCRGRREDRGASAVEYGLLLAGIAALIVFAVFAFGQGGAGLFNNSCKKIIESTNTGSCS